MRLEKVSLDHFGRRSNLHIDGLSDQLNVIFGPNGGGKSTLIQFIRWILFGNVDDVTASYLRESQGTATGAMGFVQDGRRRTIARQDDGSRVGHWVVDGHAPPETSGLAGVMGSITPSDFDLVYAPNFENEPDIFSLLQVARTRGLELTSRRRPTHRIQELRLRIDNLRREMERMPWVGQELGALIDHRSSLERRIAQVEDDYRRRRASVDREYDELNRQIADLETTISRLRDQWHLKDRDLNARRQDLDEAWRAADEARREFVSRLRQELADLENHLDRARGMLGEFQRRATRLDGDLREREHEEAASQYRREQNLCLVQSLARQLDDLRNQQRTVVEAPVFRSQFAAAPRVTTHTAALDSLRNEVGHLCQTLQDDRDLAKARALADEHTQLRQCESEIERWTTQLVEQRNQVVKQLEEADRFGVSLVIDKPYGSEPADYNGYLPEVPSHPRRVRAVLHACDGFQPISPDADELLRRLTTEREIVSRDLDTAERQLRQLLDRRRELELHLHRVQDHEIAALRREIADLDAKIRTAEERERLRREIERLEMELTGVADDIAPSQILVHASEILQDVSGGRFRDLRVSDLPTADGRGILVHEVGRDQLIPYTQVSRGVRDQIYLSVCLAMIAALRRQGLELPLILNDPFAHMDSDRGDGLAEVLSGFARRGQQVLLFTRHRHVVDWFRRHHPRYVELMPQAERAVVRPSVEEVRFRSYADAPVAAPRRLDERGSVSFRRVAERNVSEYRPLPGRPQNFQYSQPLSEARSTVPSGRARSWDSGRRDCLNGDVPLIHAGSLQASLARQLEMLGITTVDEFLRSSPDYVQRESQRRGLAPIPALQRLRDELSLRCLLPGMDHRDAAWLVSHGISSVQALADCPAESLWDWSHRQSRTDYQVSQEQLERWQRAARQIQSATRRKWESAEVGDHSAAEFQMSERSRYHDWGIAGTSFDTDRRSHSGVEEHRPYVWERYTDASKGIEPFSDPRDDDEGFSESPPPTHAARIPRSAAISAEMAPSIGRVREGSGELATPRNRVTPDERDEEYSALGGRPPRSSGRRVRSSSRSPASRSGHREASARRRRASVPRDGELRFYLNLDDAIAAAPSIGPRTASKLKSIGVQNVQDFLRGKPEDLAGRLSDSRISADVIANWQAQTTLACRVPQLRGHDAQILVACDVVDPEKLAAMTVDELWDRIGPFVKSTEGKRIIRGGKTPDKAEVSDWIEWSKEARPLQYS